MYISGWDPANPVPEHLLQLPPVYRGYVSEIITAVLE